MYPITHKQLTTDVKSSSQQGDLYNQILAECAEAYDVRRRHLSLQDRIEIDKLYNILRSLMDKDGEVEKYRVARDHLAKAMVIHPEFFTDDGFRYRGEPI